VANVIVQNIEYKSNTDFTEFKEMIAGWENTEAAQAKEQKAVFFDFDPNLITERRLDSLTLPIYLKQNILKYRKAGAVFKTPFDLRKIYGMNDSIFNLIEKYIKIEDEQYAVLPPKVKSRKTSFINFDPNTANDSILNEIGFNNFQIHNLIGYRNKGGVFKSPIDVLKIYGIDSVFYATIAAYIKIEDKEIQRIVPVENNKLLELNSADSLDLIQLEGIGPVYASRIIRYRDLLGGFYSIEQLKEVYNFQLETYENIQDKVCVDTLMITKMRLNFSEFAELLTHPYLNKQQVKALLDRREREGAYKNIGEIQSVEGFDSEMFNRIGHYLTCR
jgi:DNA uptake protein ComE-like DNA-binding protein